ncbi:glycoside hydrolase family 32 protein [Asaia siamensis]
MTEKKNDCAFSGRGRQYRPSVHFTPLTGFMNDPNGLIFDGAQYHLYYQHNPEAVFSANICWGHATSTDLLHWKDQPVALPATLEGQAYSGCAVLDRDNSSGLFPAAHGTNIVALYTRALPARQTQYLAISTDNGQNFAEYPDNPVLDIDSPNFRDPQVFFHEATRRWVMAIAEVAKHQIGFYGSIDLIHWTHLSSFGPAGLPTVNYECPNLIQIRDEQGALRWVLFVSINPGSPMGGSVTQYFIGEFDGTVFTPSDAILRLTDFAKDAYAMQVYSGLQPGDAVTLAWMGNWQYCQELPTPDWCGAMTLPRRLSIRQDPNGYPRLVQTPMNIETLRRTLLNEKATGLPKGTHREIALPTGTAIELVIRLRVDDADQADPVISGPQINRFEIAFLNGDGEKLSVGYDIPSAQIWFDRSKLLGFDHPFYTGRFATPINTALYPDARMLDLHLFLDGCTFEVHANEYLETGTALVYPVKPLDTLCLKADGIGITIDSLELYTLDKTMSRETL